MFILKGLKYLNISKKNLSSNGFLLLLETYSSLADEKKWADELKGPIFFSSSKWRVAIGYIGNNKVDVLDKIFIKMVVF